MSKAEQILIGLLDDPSFCRWIKEEANASEREKWEEWREASPLHAEIGKKARMLYSLPLEQSKGGDRRRELKRLQKRIDEHHKTAQLTSKITPGNSGYHWAAAASVAFLMVAVTAITLYFYPLRQPPEDQERSLYSNIEVGYGEKANIKISDGSRIRMNSNSTLRYSPEQFNRSQVEVWLEGEAHFSIVKGPDGKKRNFIIHTPDGDIHILGTRFNVNTRYDRTAVVLEEGSVEIQPDNHQGNPRPGGVTLQPGERAQFSSAHSDVDIQEVDTLLYTAWLDGKLEFRETPLKDLVNNIEQTYGVSVAIEDPALADNRISGSFQNPGLPELLEGIEAVLDVRIVKQKANLYLMTRK